MFPSTSLLSPVSVCITITDSLGSVSLDVKTCGSLLISFLDFLQDKTDSVQSLSSRPSSEMNSSFSHFAMSKTSALNFNGVIEEVEESSLNFTTSASFGSQLTIGSEEILLDSTVLLLRGLLELFLDIGGVRIIPYLDTSLCCNSGRELSTDT